MQKSLLYWREETVHLHQVKTETRDRIQNPDVHLKGFLHIGEPV